VEQKTYRTGFCLNRTNISTTVPTKLVQRTNTQPGTPYQYIEQDGFLWLRRFDGTREVAEVLAKSQGNIVILQGMKKPHGKVQCKINMPRWIYDQFHLAETPGRVMITWVGESQEIFGSIPIPGKAPQEAFAASVDDAERRERRKALRQEQQTLADENIAEPIAVPA
jgi:hypothetical protein